MPWKGGIFVDSVGSPKWRWTFERTILMCHLWKKGFAAREIGTRIGATKNAVIGKANRLGMRHPSREDRFPRFVAPVKTRKQQLVPTPREERACERCSKSFDSSDPEETVCWSCKKTTGCAELRGEARCGQVLQPGHLMCAEHLTERYHRDKVTG